VSEKKKAAISVGTPKRHTRSDKQMAFVLERYLAAHPEMDGPIDPDDMSVWALETGLYRHRPVTPRDALRRRISRHLGHRYFVDPQKREVRALHALRYEEITEKGVRQGVRYYPLFSTHADIIKETFQTRRGWALNRVVQIETDRLSYNDTNEFGEMIEQTSFDFDTELKEISQPKTYPAEPPPDHDDDDDKV
jgi:hypothetical protein